MAPDETQVDEFDPNEKVVPVRDEQGTELASGVGDPVAIASGLPTAGTTSDEVRAPSDTEAAAAQGDRDAARELAEQNSTAPAGSSGDTGPTVSSSAVTSAPVLPLYTHDGDGDGVDAATWPSADVKTADGRPLFHYAADVGGGAAAGDGLGDAWHVYTGDTIPA